MWCSTTCLPVSHLYPRAALDAGFSDYEDAVLYGAARAAGASAIVTRNCKDFTRSALPVFTPELLLAALHADLG